MNPIAKKFNIGLVSLGLIGCLTQTEYRSLYNTFLIAAGIVADHEYIIDGEAIITSMLCN